MDITQRADDVGPFGADPTPNSSLEERSDPSERQEAIQEAKTEEEPENPSSARTTRKTSFEAPY